MKIQRNDICPCLSDIKYKKCCLQLEEIDSVLINKQFSDDAPYLMEINEERETLCNQALDLLAEDKTTAAKTLVEEVYNDYPHDHMVNFVLGICAAKEENYSEAKKYFLEAIKIYPYFVEAFYNLGCSYLKTIHIIEAVECFKQVLKLEIKFDDEDSDLAKQAEEQLNWLNNMTLQNDGLTLLEYVETGKVFNKAYAALECKRYHVAIELFQQVLSKNPNHVQSYNNMGNAYAAQGRISLAVECFKKALALDPEYDPAMLNLFYISSLKEGERLQIPIKHTEYSRDGIL